MKIGIFDSGLGGLIITHSLTTALPDYDYIYLGDTARVPYGNRSQAIIYEFTRQAVEHLVASGCSLIIIACNTASSEALHRLQQEYLPTHPGLKILGVLIPAAEAAVGATRSGRIGVLATAGTVASGAFEREVKKLSPEAHTNSQAAPLLVPLVEHNGRKFAGPIIKEYLQPLQGCDTIILGCTHYPFFKADIRAAVGDNVNVVSQDEVVPAKLTDYLQRHPEVEGKLSRGGQAVFQVTDKTDQAARLAGQLFGQPISLELIPPFK